MELILGLPQSECFVGRRKGKGAERKFFCKKNLREADFGLTRGEKR
nr:MAG TPA: hypothetical protein [Caudoviricetes sp.]